MTASIDRMAWWQEAKFGLFIHWGLYALPAGVWKGEEIAGIGEWIMRRARIPVPEYEALAKQFNPVRFDAGEWVRLARDAGMKYIVITAKHHDGFAMYDSKVSTYDIVDATPFGRDPLRELAEACRKEGIRLCFYYSQAQDWHHPDAAGNDWDYPEESKKDFARYLEEKAKPQVRELLTEYGPIGLIWFDTPVTITREQSEALAALVHELQPGCLVNSRIGHDAGDYRSAGDNQIPACVAPGAWETPATLNNTWGYKKNDHHWKSVEVLLRLLVDIVSKGGNYLLNVGPTAEGIIPQPSVDRLRAIGEWLRVNGEAIYGAAASPFRPELEWGAITRKPGRLYLHLFQWPKPHLTLYGLKNVVKKAYLLADSARTPLPIAQRLDPSLAYHVLQISVPAQAPDERVSVIVLEIEGEPEVDPGIVQGPSGQVALEACLADLHREAPDSTINLGFSGLIEGWVDSADWLTWDVTVVTPGNFAVELITSPPRRAPWEGGHRLHLSIAHQSLRFTVEEHERRANPRSPHAQQVITRCGRITLPHPGRYTCTLRPERINAANGAGLLLRAVRMIPVA